MTLNSNNGNAGGNTSVAADPSPGPAIPELVLVSGPGAIARTGADSYVLNLGTLTSGAAPEIVQFAVVNAAASPGDSFSGVLTAEIGPFGLTLGSVGPVAPGGMSATFTQTFEPVVPGQFSETITLEAIDSVNGVLPNETLVIEGSTIACYARGTRIRTPRGDVPVESLRIGDHLLVHSGASRPIRWIGRRAYSGRFAARNRHVWPVLIRAGALADGLPARDLMVSPLHAMFLDGVLVPAEALVNGASIVQSETIDQIEYIHLEFDTHDLVLAEGAPSESFVDDDSRGMFHNAREYYALYPDAPRGPVMYCAPRVTDGFALEAIRHRLAVRAGIRPGIRAEPLRGYVDRVATQFVEGWAQNPDRLEAPVCLDVMLAGELITRALADRFRPDLAAAGLGSGRHGFFARLPVALGAREKALVEVRRSSDQRVLQRSRDRRDHDAERARRA